MVVGGDVILDRGCRSTAEQAAARLRPLRRWLRPADLALVNLECPLTARPTPLTKQYAFRCPPSAAPVLAAAGIDVLSLANNHSIDQGHDGLLDTIAALQQAGLRAAGAGEDEAAARRPVIVEAGGLRLAVVAWLDFAVEGLVPLAERPGPARLREESFEEEIRAARARADAVIVSVHWGREFSPRPTPRQRRLARRMVDAGAALVVGHHPHVLQPVERHGQGVIAYSLGNLLFDQRRSPLPRGGDPARSALLQCSISPDGPTSCRPLPLRVDACRPRPATGEEARRIREALAAEVGEGGGGAEE